MSKRWPDKYIIGLTGNIATGKSVVRKMLEHLGAYGIDADELAHRAIAKGAPGYEPVVQTFGTWILKPNGDIDRSRLGRIVFADPEALRRLEAIVHPLVLKAVEFLIDRARYRVIVVEAIKLLESDLRTWCDAIWVVDAPPEVQLKRLIQKRGMKEQDAYQRILAQPPQAEKLAQADVIIRNDGNFEKTWRQVLAAWERIPPTFREAKKPAAPHPEKAAPQRERVLVTPAPSQMALHVRRATPKDAQAISQFIARVTEGRERPTRTDIIARFGDRAYVLILEGEDRLVGLLGWQVENLVARVVDVYMLDEVPPEAGLKKALAYVEKNAQELQCEVMLVFVSPALYHRTKDLWAQLGYQPRRIEDLQVQAWQEAARESQPQGTTLLFKQLRKDRVLQPL